MKRKRLGKMRPPVDPLLAADMAKEQRATGKPVTRSFFVASVGVIIDVTLRRSSDPPEPASF